MKIMQVTAYYSNIGVQPALSFVTSSNALPILTVLCIMLMMIYMSLKQTLRIIILALSICN